MTVVPDLHAKLLGESIPGEMVRFKFRGKMLLGIVAGCDFLRIPSDKVIVVLEDISDRPGSAGKFLPMGDSMMAEACLSFGTSHIVVVHTAAPTAPEGDERFNINGVLQVGDEGGQSGAIRLRTRPPIFRSSSTSAAGRLFSPFSPTPGQGVSPCSPGNSGC